jgi:hypothetical protein
MKGRTRSRKKSAIASGESQTLMHVTSPSDSHATDTTRAGGGSVTMRSRASHSSNSSRGATTRSTNTRASSHLPDVLRGRWAFGWPVGGPNPASTSSSAWAVDRVTERGTSGEQLTPWASWPSRAPSANPYTRGSFTNLRIRYRRLRSPPSPSTCVVGATKPRRTTQPEGSRRRGQGAPPMHPPGSGRPRSPAGRQLR